MAEEGVPPPCSTLQSLLAQLHDLKATSFSWEDPALVDKLSTLWGAAAPAHLTITAAERQECLPQRMDALLSNQIFLGLGLAQQLALALAMNEVAFADGETIVEEGASVGWDDTSMFYVLTGAREYCCPSLLHCECACCHAPDRVLRVLPQLSASPKALASSKCTPRANGLASVG